MREVDNRIAAIDLNGNDIIRDCKIILVFLKKKLTELREFVQSEPFENDGEEIAFFKQYKPRVVAPLFYFHHILRIESQRPLGEEELDGHYEKQQEEQNMFFDRHVAFFQYYRSGATYLDNYYFLRGRHENTIDVDMCPLEDDSVFTTGYDQLVARIIAMEMLYAFLSVRRACLQNMDGEMLKSKSVCQWTGNAIELVELVYGLNEMGCINKGEMPINELAAFVGALLDLDIRDCYSAYTDMKRRKNESRTYFLDKMRERLNKRMQQDDEKEKKRK